MASTGFDPPPQWHWPTDLPDSGPSSSIPFVPGAFESEGTSTTYRERAAAPSGGEHVKSEGSDSNPNPRPTQPKPRQERHWPPRTCRICLEVVHPTLQAPSEHIPGVFQPAPRVSYVSSDPQDGRLLRPCKCKGSSKYVHEGCLQSWRHADPNSKRNFWQCPTCGFRYRLERMAWSRWISSNMAQVGLTITIFIFAMFLLGFIADPIINLYLDPYSAISTDPLSSINHPVLSDDDAVSWAEHFLKGLASLGLLGFVKLLFASPWNWWNLRNIGGGTRGNATGRDRLANLSWVMIMLGVATFLWGVYKSVRAWSRRTLQNAGSRVMDVGSGDDDDDE